jgi:carboxymethylenebutenolidase
MADDTLERARRGDVKAELLMVWGRQDPHVPFEGRMQIRRALEEGGANHQTFEVNGAHAFLRDEGPRYNPALARQCYGLAIELFQRKLGEGDLPASDSGAAKH